MGTTIDVIENFATGVVSSVPPDKLPDSAYTRAFNTAFAPTTGGGSALLPRPGYEFGGQLTDGGTPSTVIAMTEYVHYVGDTADSRVNIGIDDNGVVWKFDSVGATRIVFANNDGTFTENPSDHVVYMNVGTWTFAQFNNTLFAFEGSGGNDAFKLFMKPSNTTIYGAGIGVKMGAQAPTEGAVTSGVMTGDYLFRVTFYNQNTDTESNPSDPLALTLASNQIQISIAGMTVPADVTHWRLYTEKPSLQAAFWRSASEQVAIGSSTLTINLSDVDLSNQTIPMPALTTNGVLPDNVIGGAVHLSRLFVTDGKHIYYSNLGHPEQFDIRDPGGRWEPVNPLDGQAIRAIAQLTEVELAIWKERSIYKLTGDDPQNWAVANFSPSFGSYGRNVVHGDSLWTFWGQNGPTIWDGSSAPALIANEVIRSYVRQGAFSYASASDAGTIHTPIAFDPIEHRFLYSVALQGKASIWTALSWSTLQKGWESGGWDLPAPTAFTTAQSERGDRRVFFGTLNGLVWTLSRQVKTDGSALGAQAGLVHTLTARTTNTVTFTYSGAPPTNPHQRRLTVINTTTMGVERFVVTASPVVVGTTHTYTLDSSFVALPPVGSTVVLDAPVMEWDSRRISKRLLKKRYHRSWLEAYNNGDTPFLHGIFTDKNTTPTRVWSFALTTSDNDEFFNRPGFEPPAITGALDNVKNRVAGVGWSYWHRVIGWWPQSDWAISRVALEWEPRSYAR